MLSLFGYLQIFSSWSVNTKEIATTFTQNVFSSPLSLRRRFIPFDIYATNFVAESIKGARSSTEVLILYVCVCLAMRGGRGEGGGSTAARLQISSISLSPAQGLLGKWQTSPRLWQRRLHPNFLTQAALLLPQHPLWKTINPTIGDQSTEPSRTTGSRKSHQLPSSASHDFHQQHFTVTTTTTTATVKLHIPRDTTKSWINHKWLCGPFLVALQWLYEAHFENIRRCCGDRQCKWITCRLVNHD